MIYSQYHTYDIWNVTVLALLHWPPSDNVCSGWPALSVLYIYIPIRSDWVITAMSFLGCYWLGLDGVVLLATSIRRFRVLIWTIISEVRYGPKTTRCCIIDLTYDTIDIIVQIIGNIIYDIICMLYTRI